MLAGHKRYAHIAALRCDAVLPELLGMRKIVSEDAIRRAFKAIDETEGAVWLRGHLAFCVEPLLAEPWILDVDTTVKPLYGHQKERDWASMSLRATSVGPNTARRAHGVSRPYAARPDGLRCCAAAAASATKASCARRKRDGCPISSSCA